VDGKQEERDTDDRIDRCSLCACVVPLSCHTTTTEAKLSINESRAKPASCRSHPRSSGGSP
jgi:hypothetical protein